jgi:rubredoxin
MELKELIETARRNLRENVKCPLCCGKAVYDFTDEIGDHFICNECGLIFIIP